MIDSNQERQEGERTEQSQNSEPYLDEHFFKVDVEH